MNFRRQLALLGLILIFCTPHQFLYGREDGKLAPTGSLLATQLFFAPQRLEEKRSQKRSPETDKILVYKYKTNFLIVDGHHEALALKDQGFTQVQVSILEDLSHLTWPQVVALLRERQHIYEVDEPIKLDQMQPEPLLDIIRSLTLKAHITESESKGFQIEMKRVPQFPVWVKLSGSGSAQSETHFENLILSVIKRIAYPLSYPVTKEAAYAIHRFLKFAQTDPSLLLEHPILKKLMLTPSLSSNQESLEKHIQDALTLNALTSSASCKLLGH